MSGDITVQVDFYAALQKVFGDQPYRMTLSASGTVGTLLEKMADTSERRGRLFDPSGGLRQDITVLKNGRNINFIGGLGAGLGPGDVVAVFPPTYGG